MTGDSWAIVGWGLAMLVFWLVSGDDGGCVVVMREALC